MASSSSSQAHIVIDVPSTNGNNEHDDYLDPNMHRDDLYKAVVTGNWDKATEIFDQNPNEAMAKLMEMESMNPLHVAVGTSKAKEFMERLVEKMSEEDVAKTNENELTALAIAAAVGNIIAVKLLVPKNRALLNIMDPEYRFPVHMAAQYGHRETYEYLFEETKRDEQRDEQPDEQPSPYKEKSGILLLRQLILAGFYDLAVDLVEKNPGLALAKFEEFELESPLCSIAVMHSAFFSTSFSLTLSSENVANNSRRGDAENQANNSPAPICYGATVRQKLVTALWKVIESLVPRVKHIRDMKLMHYQALRLVDLCIRATELDPSRSAGFDIFKEPFFVAAQHGVSEIVEKIIKSFPLAVQFRDNENRNIFHRAVLFRRHKIFNLISRISLEHKLIVVEHLDRRGNSILHLVGNLAPPDQLNRVSGAALQMQRELQWFKEVEKVVPNIHRDLKNEEGEKTPRMVFTEEHKELAKEGERWMKDTANSCSVVAALIATVVFAAAITVPGGTNGHTGFPVFKSKKAFFIFAVSDALSLFSSTAAILMFLSIRTARYAEDDFLRALPKRLIMGFFTLFISITTMMIAFSSTLYLVFGNDKTWILVSVAVSACLLVVLFIFLQIPLLVDIFCYTYGPGLFGNRREDPMY